jgi:hypothetical protein
MNRLQYRKFWYRGHTKVCNQIIVKAYDTKMDDKGVVWLRFGGLTPCKTLKLPTTLPIKCQLRLITPGSLIFFGVREIAKKIENLGFVMVLAISRNLA